MAFRNRWSDELRQAMIHAALHEGRSGTQVHRMAHEGAFPDVEPADIPLATVQQILGRARREQKVRDIAQMDPAAVLDEAAGTLVEGVRRETERYRLRVRSKKAKPGEAAALAKDAAEVAKLLRLMQDGKRTHGKASPEAKPAPEDFVGGLARNGA